MENFEVVEIIEGAKTALLTYGWVQETFGDVSIGFCAQGAVDHSMTQIADSCDRVWMTDECPYWSPFTIVLDHLAHDISPGMEPSSSNYLVLYNDADVCTKQDILDLMDRTIKRLLDENVSDA